MRTIEENKKLGEKYPFLILRTDYWTDRVLPEDEIDYEHTWWDDIPEGWAKAFGEQMCDELLEILKEGDYVDEYQIIQIKEKYGMLRIYSNGVPENISDKHHEWLRKYEELSEKTCINCGAPAVCMTKGWIMPVCQSCYDEIENRQKKYLEKIKASKT